MSSGVVQRERSKIETICKQFMDRQRVLFVPMSDSVLFSVYTSYCGVNPSLNHYIKRAKPMLTPLEFFEKYGNLEPFRFHTNEDVYFLNSKLTMDTSERCDSHVYSVYHPSLRQPKDFYFEYLLEVLIGDYLPAVCIKDLYSMMRVGFGDIISRDDFELEVKSLEGINEDVKILDGYLIRDSVKAMEELMTEISVLFADYAFVRIDMIPDMYKMIYRRELKWLHLDAFRIPVFTEWFESILLTEKGVFGYVKTKDNIVFVKCYKFLKDWMIRKIISHENARNRSTSKYDDLCIDLDSLVPFDTVLSVKILRALYRNVFEELLDLKLDDKDGDACRKELKSIATSCKKIYNDRPNFFITVNKKNELVFVRDYLEALEPDDADLVATIHDNFEVIDSTYYPRQRPMSVDKIMQQCNLQELVNSSPS